MASEGAGLCAPVLGKREAQIWAPETPGTRGRVSGVLSIMVDWLVPASHACLLPWNLPCLPALQAEATGI